MTSPYPTEIVSLNEVLDHLNIDNPDDEALRELPLFIAAATEFIQDLTGPILPTQFVEVHSGGGPRIVLFNPPVLAVTEVVEFVAATGYTLTQSELGQSTGAYAFSVDSPSAGILTRRYNGGLAGNFVGGDRNIKVTYLAGRATVPPDLKMAVLQDIAGLYQPSQLGPGASVFPNSLGNGAPEARLNPIGLFPRVAAIVSAAKMRVPAIG